jgi:hypothetical protein
MYVFFRIGGAKGFADSAQGGYGFALDSGTAWNVIGFGPAQVRCRGADRSCQSGRPRFPRSSDLAAHRTEGGDCRRLVTPSPNPR